MEHTFRIWTTACCWLIVGVLATDRDLSGRIKYAITGDGMAPAFFRIDELTGRIYLRDGVSLRDDRNINYTVRPYAYISSMTWWLLLYIAAAVACIYCLTCLQLTFRLFTKATSYSRASLDDMKTVLLGFIFSTLNVVPVRHTQKLYLPAHKFPLVFNYFRSITH